MTQKRQIEVLLAAALLCFAVVIGFGMFYNSGVKVYQVEAASVDSSEAIEESNGSSAILAVEKLNINTADFFELIALPGVGEVTADGILEYRDKHGRFQSIDQLMEVPGIGEGKLEKLKEYITVD